MEKKTGLQVNGSFHRPSLVKQCTKKSDSYFEYNKRLMMAHLVALDNTKFIIENSEINIETFIVSFNQILLN